jgi:acetolactate synthase-1/3 small subunit
LDLPLLGVLLRLAVTQHLFINLINTHPTNHNNSLDVLERELVVVKVNCVPLDNEEDSSSDVLGESSEQPNAMGYDELMSRHFHRQAVLEIAKMFDARTVDIGSDHIMLEMVSWPKRVGAFVRLLQPFGIIEAAR